MSWLPVYNCWLFMLGLLGAFLWKLWGGLLLVVVVGVSVFCLVKEVALTRYHYSFGFWLFILSEVLIFATLFVVIIWSADNELENISGALELPLLGSFLLLGSSITVTTYHHWRGLGSSSVYLFITVLLGLCFVLMQIQELYDCECDVLSGTYQAASFCTVGLHFLHVVVGVLALLVVFFIGGNYIKQEYADFAVWYWHFVDYVWLFVFLFIYFL